MQTKMNEDLVKILYQGTFTYYPNIADKLEAYIEGKIAQASKEAEAIEVVDPSPMLYKLLNNAAKNGDVDLIDVASKAIQRLKF